jgi:HK97 family phage major capsid protein
MSQKDNGDALLSQIEKLSSDTSKMDKALEDIKTKNKTAPSRVSPTPAVRKGEDTMSSRGYSFVRLLKLMAGQIGVEDARLEAEVHNKLNKCLFEGHGYRRSQPNTILAPMATEFMPLEDSQTLKMAREIREVVKAGVFGVDANEYRAIANQVNKTLSWTDETGLGALVAPPLMGELIEILRNNEALMAAGCTTIAMPPNGRIVYPRQTGASTAYWVGENQQITEGDPTTGDLTLQAKKLAALVKLPNELFRYAAIAVEAFLRDDMMKVLGLRLDKDLLEGVGSTNSPKGLINYASLPTHTCIGTPADANSGYPFQPEDVTQMIGVVEEANAEFKGFIMRPLMWAYIANRRADAVSSGDAKGMFMFNILRELQDPMHIERRGIANLSGYPVVKSTQLSNTHTRGSGSTNNTYILGGDFKDYMIAMSPVIEFAQTQVGDTAFQNDQTWVRAIVPCDGAPKRLASFVLCDQLLYQ